MRMPRAIAARLRSIASSRRRELRCETPYARITSAPTTVSAIAPSIAPTRSRTRPYAAASRRWKSRTITTSGRNDA